MSQNQSIRDAESRGIDLSSAHYHVTNHECSSMRLLATDGWSVGELRMTFHLSNTAQVNYHVRGDCACNSRIDPIPDWENQAPAKRSRPIGVDVWEAAHGD